ncbi:neuraminidase-like domain-containing protein [Pseudomonas citrulli]|uniref:Neuraminidase-like domain-containing protein n=1 Tax=Pseudomonas citrulli TaxID=3064347 RepID=A0ABT9C8H5_9PSED|nr:neuraminidase-like domain-containing protein [Pseudomonas sp. K18]MDO7899429.1 neuraminidase-like domain-containing protein [Pseudomonas sp. K18]
MKAGIVNELEEQRRDALVAYYLGQIVPSSHTAAPLRLTTPEDLYEYLLIDNQVSAQVQTSRVAQGIASLQQYIHAIYNGMEPGYPYGFSAEELRLWRESMSQYSIWAGYQMIEDYPENYIDPTLRLGKTSPFKTLENDLGQSRLTEDSVQTALRNYLSQFELVSNLKIVSGYIDGTDFRRADYYFVGRQNVEPFAAYWRKAAIDLNDSSTHVSPAAWSEWKTIDVVFEAGVTQARLVVIRGRLHLVWVEVGQPEANDDGGKTGKYFYSAKMTYKQVNDQWSPATVLYTGLTQATNLTDRLSAERHIDSGAFSVAMDLRDASAPRLVVAFYLSNHMDLHVYDELFSKVNLNSTESAELARVAGTMFGDDSTRLQFPYVGIDTGAPEVDWIIGSIVWDRDSPHNYYPPSNTYPDALNPYLEFKATLHMQRTGEGEPSGGKIEVQGSCQAVRMERQAIQLLLEDGYVEEWYGQGLAKYQVEVYFSIFYESGQFFAVCEITNIVPFFQEKKKHSHTFSFFNDRIGSIDQDTPGTQIGVDWNSPSCPWPFRKMRYKISLPTMELKSFPSFSPEAVWSGASFEVESTVERVWWADPEESHTLKFINKSNVFVDVLGPISRNFGVWYAYENGGQYKEDRLGHVALTLNGAAKTPLFTKNWTGTTDTTYAFPFGVARGADPGLGWNRFLVSLSPMLRDVPRVTTTAAGAQFLDLQALKLPSLRYVRLNSLFAAQLVAKSAFSVEAVLSWESQHTEEPPLPGSSQPVPLDFDGANGRYFWEIFFHAPHLVARRLHSEFDYLGAETWYHAVFNPLARIQPLYPAPSVEYPYWCVRPLAQPDRPAEQFFGLGGLRDPDAIAYGAPSHYRKAIFTDYVKNLIARGDMLYRQLTRDALNEAKLLYVRALSLLGPLSKGRSISRWEPMPLVDAAAYDSELFSAFESSIQTLFAEDIPRHIQGEPWWRLIDAPWFRLPVNTQLLELWSDLDLRLGNLRNNLTLDGKPLLLALYETPARPFDLLRAQLAGENGGARRLGSLAIIPPYRFRAMLPRVQNAVDTLIRFGEQVRAYMELRDRSQQEELLQAHVQELSEFAVTLQEQAIEQARSGKSALTASKAMVAARQGYYERLRQEDVSANEKKIINERLAAGIINTVTSAAMMAAHGIDATAPNMSGASWGVNKPAGFAFAVSSALEIASKGLMADAERRTQDEQYRRRREEWDFQIEQAKAEIEALGKQIDTQRIVIASASTGLQQAGKAREQAEIYYDFLKHRAAGPGLYQWLLSQMATLYFQAYDAVLSMCLATEAGWQYEIGDRDTRFIPHDAWADNRHGLSAGEALKLGLLRMESAFLNRHERRLELTKTISLKDLLKDYDPNAAHDGAVPKATGWEAVRDQLRSEGEITFHLNSSLFDKDYPGHYLRQLVGVSLSFPVVLGPYQDIHATLVQTRSSTLLKPSLGGVASLYSQAGELAPDNDIELDPRHIVFNPRLSQQVGLSSGLDDYGLFTLNFDDERYLPFEGTGAVSSWMLSFPRHPSAHQEAIFDSLTDIILQVRYLAVDGGKAFAAQVEPLVAYVEHQESVRTSLLASPVTAAR